MHYKEYGKTGERVSAIGMGCMRFDERHVQNGDFDACAEVVRYAHEKGINYFDTAPEYCEDKSEEILGLGLYGLPRGSFYVTSKTNFGMIDNPATEAGFFRRLEKSLKRLRVDYLDFYHLWCMLSLKGYQKQCGVMYDWFLKAKEQGMIKHIVVSSHMEGADIAAMLGEEKFEGVLLGYNALNYQYRMEGIRAAHKLNLGVVVMNPLSGGVIPENAERFPYINEGTGLSPAAAALRFVAEHREVSVALCGFTTKAHVDDAMRAVEGLNPRPCDEVVAAFLKTGEGFNTLCTGCGYCDSCPEGIPIPKYMDAYNHHMLGSTVSERLTNHWSLPHEGAGICTDCGQCEQLCTQRLPIRERLKEIAGRIV